MQRDVLRALERVTQAHHGLSVSEAMIRYGLEFGGMSEYEAYFSFAWYFYNDRIDIVNIPYVMRKPELCNYDSLAAFRESTIIVYSTCHDNFGGDDVYTNCRGREERCDLVL